MNACRISGFSASDQPLIGTNTMLRFRTVTKFRAGSSAISILLWMALIYGISAVSASATDLPEGALAGFKSDEFKVREAAQAELLAWGRVKPDAAKEFLFDQSRRAEDPEVRERCLAVLRDLVIDEYLQDGEGYVGIRMQDEVAAVPGSPKPLSAIRVIEVVADTAAHQAGLRLNDLIVGLEGGVWPQERGAASLAFSGKVRQFKPGTRITLKILRDGKLLDVALKLGRRPPYADNPFLEMQGDLESLERAAKDAYFRRWLEAHRRRE